MQNRISSHWILLTLAFFPFSSTALADSTAGTLTVNISNIQSDAGQIGCSLYSNKDGFPSEPEKAADQMFVKSKAGKATCVFKDLKPGKYAVSVMHDEDEDGELKTSMVGRPKEWWGVSNNVPPERFGPPKYEAASFAYDGQPKKIQVKLRL